MNYQWGAVLISMCVCLCLYVRVMTISLVHELFISDGGKENTQWKNQIKQYAPEHNITFMLLLRSNANAHG